MRIRHPCSAPPARKADNTCGTSKGSTDTSNTHPTTNSKHICNISSADHVSTGAKESADDTNTAYLKPDFLDPMTLTHCEAACPSPLALLAKTCQNIGQMLESGPRVSHSSIFHSKEQNTFPTVSISNRVSLVGRVQKPKPCNTRTETEILQGVKRQTPGRSKCARVDRSAMSPTSNRNESPECRSASSRLENPINDQKTFSHSYPSPESGCCQRMLQLQSDCSAYATDTVSNADTRQTTSNALAQLARLSSSLVAPESSKLVRNQSDQLDLKDRGAFNDVVRLQAGMKRHHRGTIRASKSYVSNSNMPALLLHPNDSVALNQRSPEFSSATSCFHKPIANCYAPATSPVSVHSSSNGYSSEFGGFWSELYQIVQQAGKYGEKEPPQQNLFLYTLARKFLDLFYAKLPANSQHPHTDFFCPQQENVGSEPATEKVFTSFGGPFASPHQTSDVCQWYKPTSRSEPSHASVQASSSTQCLLCGLNFATAIELCRHVYIHLLSSFREPNETVPLASFQKDSHAGFLAPYACGFSSATSVAEGSNTVCDLDKHWTPFVQLIDSVYKSGWSRSDIPPAAQLEEINNLQHLIHQFGYNPHQNSCPQTDEENGTYQYWLRQLFAQCISTLPTRPPNSVMGPSLEQNNMPESSSSAFAWTHPASPKFGPTFPHVTLLPNV
ncbi:unnamed protein product [Dicrocoelium dendriticum]|nr:unnamed protein product [Dicrocoelium dendriticum]